MLCPDSSVKRGPVLFAGLRFFLHDGCMMHPDYMATPIYDSVVAVTPYPVLTVDIRFAWKRRPSSVAPRPGQKPRRKKRR